MRGGSDVRVLLLFHKLVLWNDDWIVRDRTHARYYELTGTEG